MRLLSLRSRHGRTHVVLLGSGLLGEAVRRALGRLGEGTEQSRFPFPWDDRGGREATERDLTRRLAGAEAPIHVVWAAGRSGFGSSAADMAAETVLVEETARLAIRLDADLHHISSAGGLFEGQRLVSANDAPSPLRPYGEGKLEQEERLAAMAAEGLRATSYRPSTVYGYAPGGRLGLVGVLVRNALAQRSTTITGAADTLRDYVHAEDCGRQIAERMLAGAPPAPPILLASGRPASLGRVLEVVRTASPMPLLVRIDASPANARPITFRPSGLPAGFRPRDLETGVRGLVATMTADWREAA